jgi:hypothetical protein
MPLTPGTIAALVFWATIALVVAYHTSQTIFYLVMFGIVWLAMGFSIIFILYSTSLLFDHLISRIRGEK